MRNLIQGNGTTYTTLRTFTPAYHIHDLAVPSALLASQFRVRIGANMNTANDVMYVDDLEITGVLR